jgi:hypothetical protein
MIKSSALQGRNWKPSKTDEQYQAEALRDHLDAFAVVAEKTGRTITELTLAISTRKTPEGMPS